MSWFENCPICFEFVRLSEHKCLPAWWACGDPTGEDYDVLTIYARDASEAAEAYAKKHDRAQVDFKEYQDVYVRRIDGDGKLYKVDVRMEMEPIYSTFGDPVEYAPEPDDEEADIPVGQ